MLFNSVSHVILENIGTKFDALCRLHFSSWRCLGHSLCSNRKQHWGIRQKPKTKLFKELKLSTSRGLAHDDDLGIDKLVCGWEEQTSDERSCHANADSSLCNVSKCNWGKQLFQFDKSHRPAFYGIWRKKR